MRVFLKPNMVEYKPGTSINTNPMVVAGAAAAFLSGGAKEVIVGEGPGHRRDTEYLLTSTGLLDHLREGNLKFIDLNQDNVPAFTFAESLHRVKGVDVSRFLASIGLRRFDAEAEDPPLGGNDLFDEESLWNGAGGGLRVAQKHPSLRRYRAIRSSI